MHKFKFGDKVLCNWQGRQFEAVFVAFWEEEGNPGWGWIEVLEENETSTTDVGCDCVKPIPHPDTVRLDWLQNNNVQIFRNATYRKDIDKDYKGDDYIHTLESEIDFEFGNAGITDKTVINDLREAIDDERCRSEIHAP